MIRVTIEFVPFGVEDAASTIGELRIWNDGTGTPEVGNYRWAMLASMRGQAPIEQTGAITGFKRLEHDAGDLVALALSAAQEGRNA